MSWLDDYRHQGFGVIRGFVSQHEVHELREAFDHLVALAREAPSEPGPDEARFVVEDDPFRLHRVVWCGAADPVLARYGDDPRVLQVAGAALEATELVQLIQQAHFKFPGDEVSFAWHQDASNRRYGSELWSDVDGLGSFVQMGLAVDPMTSDNGPLKMLPGSHRLGFVADPKTGVLPAEVLGRYPVVDVLLEPGDLAVFGPFTIHGSPANRSAIPRRLFLQGYAQVGANHRVYPGCGTGVLRHVP